MQKPRSLSARSALPARVKGGIAPAGVAQVGRGFQGREAVPSGVVVWGGWPGVLAAAGSPLGCRRHARPALWARTKYTALLKMQKRVKQDTHAVRASRLRRICWV